MMKIGDVFTTVSSKTKPTNSFDRCQYCNNLSKPSKEQGIYFRGLEVKLKDLCNEYWNLDCSWCPVFARLIRSLEPEVQQMVDTYPERPMCCVINRYNVISIIWESTETVPPLVIIERCSFQLYRSPSSGMYGWTSSDYSLRFVL